MKVIAMLIPEGGRLRSEEELRSQSQRLSGRPAVADQ